MKLVEISVERKDKEVRCCIQRSNIQMRNSQYTLMTNIQMSLSVFDSQVLLASAKSLLLQNGRNEADNA